MDFVIQGNRRLNLTWFYSYRVHFIDNAPALHNLPPLRVINCQQVLLSMEDFWMQPTLKLIGFAIAPLIFSLPIALLMGDQAGSATSFAQTNANTQESISEKKAEGDHNSHYLLRLGERDCEKYQVFCFELVA